MPQFDYGVIDPSTKSGSQLASDLSNFRTAVNSFHLGTNEPSYKVQGMVWVDTSASPVWRMRIYDGAAWIILIDINTTSDTASAYIGGVLASIGTAAARNVGSGAGEISLNSALGVLAFLNSVGTSNIDNGAITSALIAANAITTAAIANAAVTNQKVADSTLTLSKFATTTANKLLGTNSSGVVSLVDQASGGGANLYSTAGTYTFIVPNGVTVLRVWVIGGGGGGNGASLNSQNTYGGSGGTSSFGGYISATGGSSTGGGGTGVKGTDLLFAVTYSGGSGSGQSQLNSGGMPYFMGPLTGADTAYYRGSIYYYGNGGVWPGGGAAGLTRNGYSTGVGAGAGGSAFAYITVTAGQSISVTVGAGGAGGAGNNATGRPGAAGMVLVEW